MAAHRSGQLGAVFLHRTVGIGPAFGQLARLGVQVRRLLPGGREPAGCLVSGVEQAIDMR